MTTKINKLKNLASEMFGWKKIYRPPRWVQKDMDKRRILSRSKIYVGKNFKYKVVCPRPYENQGHPSEIHYYRKEE